MVSRTLKSKLKKNEKNHPRYLAKEQVYQISDKSVKFWPVEAAPKFWDIQTHTQTFSDYSSTEVENTYLTENEEYVKHIENLYKISS